MVNITSILHSSTFFLIPILVGIPFLVLLKKKQEDTIRIYDLTSLIIKGAFSFILGSLVILLQTGLLIKFQGIDATLYLKAMLGGEIVLGILTIVFYVITQPKRIRVTKKELLSYLIIVGLSLVGFYIWGINSPPGSALNWDMFMHQSAVFEIQKGVFSLDTTKIIDTFKFYSYTPLFHTLILSSQLFIKGLKVLDYWWYAQYFHYLITIIASYVLAKRATNSDMVGIISATFGAFIFESLMAYTSLILIPQTVAATALAFVLAELIHKKNMGNKLLTPKILLSLIFLFLTHFIIGTGAAAILLFSLLFLYSKRESKKTLNGLMILGAVLIPVIYYTSLGFDLSGLNGGEALSFSLTLRQKFDFFNEIYGYSAILFLPLGIFFALKEGYKYKIALMITLTLIVLGVIFGNFPYILKVYTLGRYLVHVVMAYGAAKLIIKLPSYLKLFSYLLLLVMLISVFSINTYNFKGSLFYGGEASSVKRSELMAANFLSEKNYSKDSKTMLLSDPTTMHIFEGLTGINTPGGAFTNKITRESLSKIFISRDSKRMKKQLFSIANNASLEPINRILFVISGRFSKWQLATEAQRLGVVWNIWQPSDLTYNDYEFVNFINEYTDFKIIVNSPEIVIYELTN